MAETERETGKERDRDRQEETETNINRQRQAVRQTDDAFCHKCFIAYDICIVHSDCAICGLALGSYEPGP